MPQTLFTAADLLAMEGDFELDRGRLVAVTPAHRPHGRIHLAIGSAIRDFVEKHDLGEVYADLGCWIERDPDTVRGPDVAFVRWERLEAAGDEEEGWYEGPPDLAVEVTGSRPGLARARRRIGQLVGAGCPLLWHVFIPDRTVTVHAVGQASRVLHEGEELDGGEVLPGFRWSVADLFRRRRRSS